MALMSHESTRDRKMVASWDSQTMPPESSPVKQLLQCSFPRLLSPKHCLIGQSFHYSLGKYSRMLFGQMALKPVVVINLKCSSRSLLDSRIRES